MDIQRLGAFIQRRRKDLGMTQAELGAKLNVTDKAVSRWERGVGFPDIKLLEPMAEALQISLQELMRCERMELEPTSAEMTDEGMEASRKSKKESWFGKHRRVLAELCFLIYMLLYMLSRNPSFVKQLVWISPLDRLLFLVTVVAFLYASYREVDYGTD